MLKISGKNRGCLIVLNIPQLREKINKTCANRPVSCVNEEVRTEFGSLKEPAYRCAAALGRRACPLSLAPLASSPFGSNGDDRRQRRKQGGAVGAAASRMQATARQTLGAATRSPYLRRKLPPRLPALLSRHFPRSALYLLYICILPVLCAKSGIFFDFRK